MNLFFSLSQAIFSSRADSIRESRLCFNIPQKEVIQYQSVVKDRERNAGKVETFDATTIDHFFKQENIKNKNLLDEHLNTYHLEKFLKYSRDTERTSLTADELKLLAFYETKPHPTDPVPDVRKLSADIEKQLQGTEDQLKASPASASLLAEKTRLLAEQTKYRDIQLIEEFGILEMNQKLAIDKQRQEDRIDAVTENGGSLGQALSDTYKDVKKNWRKMSSGEKWFMAIAGIVTAYVLNQKQGETTERVKTFLFGLGKWSIVGLFANQLVKLKTGKSAVGWLGQMADDSANKTELIKEKFGTDQKEAEIFKKGMVFLDTLKYNEIFPRYSDMRIEIEAARRDNESLVDLAKRNPELFSKMPRKGEMKLWEVYIALDVFFKRYEPEIIGPKYQNEPDLSFIEMLSREMVDDPSCQWRPGGFMGVMFDDGLAATSTAASSAYEAVAGVSRSVLDRIKTWGLGENVEKVVDATGTFFKVTYRDHKLFFQEVGSGALNLVKIGLGILPFTIYHGAKVVNWTAEYIDQFIRHQDSAYEAMFAEHITDVSNLPDLFSNPAYRSSQGIFFDSFQKAHTRGAFDTTQNKYTNEPYYEDPAGNAAYYIVRIPMKATGMNRDFFINHYNEAYTKAADFLSTKNNVAGEYIEAVTSTVSAADNQFNLLIRAPKKTSLEYVSRRSGEWPAGPAYRMKKATDLLEASFKAVTPLDRDEIQWNNGLRDAASVTKLLNYFQTLYGGKGYSEKAVLTMMKNMSPEERYRILHTELHITNLYPVERLAATKDRLQSLKGYMALALNKKGIVNEASETNRLYYQDVLRRARTQAFSTILRASDATLNSEKEAAESEVIRASLNALVTYLVNQGKVAVGKENDTLNGLIKGFVNPDGIPWVPFF
ncbi:hypothetical protein HZA41_02925 [Candidatus Peregrinibacteria bacterium]|nr:hypothetical protein [Candidatus Peregrinibacteria bacterium]